MVVRLRGLLTRDLVFWAWSSYRGTCLLLLLLLGAGELGLLRYGSLWASHGGSLVGWAG